MNYSAHHHCIFFGSGSVPGNVFPLSGGGGEWATFGPLDKNGRVVR